MCTVMNVRTNIVISEELIREAMDLSGEKTKRAVVDRALRELIERDARIKGTLELQGIGWDGDLDEMRRDRDFD